MTPEQLDAIEKYAVRRDEATAQILMLVKALREAQKERDAAKEDAKTQGAMHHRYYWRFMACAEAAGMDEQLNAEKIAKAEKERDEARAEVAQLRETVKTAGDRLRACRYQLTEHAYQEMASVLEDLPASAEEVP